MGKGSGRSAAKIKEIFRFRSSSLPFKYLGALLLISSLRQRHFVSFIPFIRLKLLGWRAKSLSFVGKVILVRHTLASMPLHIVMVIPLPRRVSDSIEQCMRNFLWSALDLKLIKGQSCFLGEGLFPKDWRGSCHSQGS